LNNDYVTVEGNNGANKMSLFLEGTEVLASSQRLED
jgi:hypothetical protein